MAIVPSDRFKLLLSLLLVGKNRKIRIDHLFFYLLTQDVPETECDPVRVSLKAKYNKMPFAVRDVKRMMSKSLDELLDDLNEYNTNQKHNVPLKTKDLDIDDILESLF